MIRPERPDNLSALLANEPNKSALARQLGVPRSTLWRWLKQIGVTAKSKVAESEADDTPNQIRALRVLEQQLERMHEKLMDERRRREIAEDDLAAVQEESSILRDTLYAPLTISPYQGKGRTKNSAVAVLLCSDFHAESRIDPEMVNGLNEYNLDICSQRVQRLFRKAVFLTEFAGHICHIRDMVIWLGGDLINGFIHEELEENNFLGPAEAVVFISELVSGGINFLLESGCVDKINVICSMGNHGRSTKKTRVSTGYRSSWEYLAYRNLESSYKNNPQVRWIVNRSYFTYVDILGFTCRFSHGDAIRYAGGIGGITIPVEKAIKSWNEGKHADYDFFGHYHQLIENQRWVCNGSLVGYDPYALSIKARYEPPRQALCIIDEEYGKTMTLPVFVEKPRHAD